MSGRWIHRWDPEDPGFWAATGRRVATRNLVFSIFVEHLGFAVWLLWSAVVVLLPKAGFPFTVDQLFWLVAVPNLVGATLRLPYTFAVSAFGGRNWTVVSALLLLLPVGLLAVLAADPATPYGLFLLAAATAGLGGGNFASSMANISYFYPERRKGFALGVNAAGGNLGVAVVQLVVPLAAAAGLAYAGLVWLPLVAAAAVCAYFFMDNLAVATAGFASQARALKRKHTWVMSFLYIGTFGSFIGYSAAFPLVVKTAFAGSAAPYVAFLGPLVGSLARPVGGWLSDRYGGARVTAWSFVAMAAGVAGALAGLRWHAFPMFLGAFLLLFVASGTGNGSTYRMIPAIFAAQGAPENARPEAAACIGIASAVGAFGGFLIPRGFAMSISQTGSVAVALYAFLSGYAVFLVTNWWFYRRRVLAARAPSLAHSRI
ncbi:MFS transporter [Nonomuraea roseoviolacea]|uniref:NNP family nitrate/nitrite transporter-like MFS transporter n=1 Tax=Nonomuraea roseoviolacea subsp. carminata TaxID=160689 RepID=A0ABT1KGV2_9ACTN|nr:MFS transporter [Nonomuraea roseoviolacea]MCP2352869.1 NNP family nitrate/nitrite transporter-like MFS transporter [Nonomuraea roseoviolacea subsp. carminata]